MDINLFNWTEIARKLEVTQVYVHLLLTGQRHAPSRLKQIANICGISPDNLKRQIAKNKNGQSHSTGGAHPPTPARLRPGHRAAARIVRKAHA